MTYPQTIRYLASFVNYERIPAWPYNKSLKLKRFRDFLAAINNPQDSLRCIHVAGTKGKGSVCAFISYILKEAGYRVGLYTSPHLVDFRERIRVLPSAGGDFEGMVERKDLVRLAEKLKHAINSYCRKSKCGPLSFFEIYTALAFVYFKEQKVDFAVLETGLGGRLDATNTVKPLVCAITSLSYEHTDKLGRTLSRIAREKAGIIKPGQRLVISAPQTEEPMRVIRQRCRETGAQLRVVGKDIRYTKNKHGFSVEGVYRRYGRLKTRLLGEHQLVNASVAIGIAEALNFDYNIKVTKDAIRAGIYQARWPARCQLICRNPLIVLDGAQNVASANVLKKAIQANFQYKRLILVLGISSDKDIPGICKELYDLADVVILTAADSPRATNPKELAGYFPDKLLRLTSNVKEAKRCALGLAEKKDLILVCGSLFVAGEFINA